MLALVKLYTLQEASNNKLPNTKKMAGNKALVFEKWCILNFMVRLQNNIA